MAGSSTAEPAQPAFYFDLASPEAYLAAERVLQACRCGRVDPGARARPAGRRVVGGVPLRDEQEIALGRIERSPRERGLQPVRWPEPFPFDSAFAMRAATYAKQIGRTVAFALAAFRQAYAGGRSLDAQDNVLSRRRRARCTRRRC